MSTQPQVDSSGNTWAERQAVSSVTVENAAAVAALLSLEKSAIDAVSGPLRQLLNNVFRVLAGRYVLMFGGLDKPASDPALARQLVQIMVDEIQTIARYDPTAALTDAARQALEHGVDYANKYLIDPVAVDTVDLSDVTTQTIADAASSVADSVRSATSFAEQLPITGWDDLVRDMGKANQAATSLERSVTTVVNRASSEAIKDVAGRKGAKIVWVAEPDACVVCLALSGHVIDPMAGEEFDQDATFGAPGSAMDVWPPGMALMSPPRHPNCRCHPELWFGRASTPGGPEETSLYSRPDVGANVDWPAALRREAKRSIVYGWSLPSESGTVRLEAADRLLKAGAGLPRTVEARGRAAVSRGQFDNRVHPSRRRTVHRLP